MSWRHSMALKAILESECIVSEEDKSWAFKKLLRFADEPGVMDMFRILIHHGVDIDDPIYCKVALKRLLNIGQMEICEDIIQVVCATHGNNVTKGMLLLALASCKLDDSVKFTDPCTNTRIEPTSFYSQMFQHIMTSSFDSRMFLLDSKVWLKLSAPTFQCLLYLLPLLIQLMPQTLPDIMSEMVRKAMRAYPLLSSETKHRVHLLPSMLLEAGYDMKYLLKKACISPRSESYIGFDQALQKQVSGPLPLSTQLRIDIRSGFSTSSCLFDSVRELGCTNGMPRRLMSYILMEDISPLPWSWTY